MALAVSYRGNCGSPLTCASSGWSITHSATPCILQKPKLFGLGRILSLHSTHSDSGTRCSVHQSAATLSGAPRSAEKRGNFQPVSWPSTRTPARKTKTARLAMPPTAADNRRGTGVGFSFWPGDGDVGDGPAMRLDMMTLPITLIAHS